MSEMGDMFREMREMKQGYKRDRVKENTPLVLDLAKSLGVSVTTLPGGLRFHIPNTNESIDFWPSSAKWAHHTWPRSRKMKVMQGVENFAERIRDRVNANREK